jgi:glucose-6-phosphate isomerase
MKSAILDDSKKFKALDKSGMLDFCLNSSKIYSEAAKLSANIQLRYPKPDNIIVAGMGGSGIGGDLLKDWAEITISRNTPAKKPSSY